MVSVLQGYMIFGMIFGTSGIMVYCYIFECFVGETVGYMWLNLVPNIFGLLGSVSRNRGMIFIYNLYCFVLLVLNVYVLMSVSSIYVVLLCSVVEMLLVVVLKSGLELYEEECYVSSL
jgi:hypothetical protein